MWHASCIIQVALICGATHPFERGWIVTIRCKYVGLIAGLAIALSVSAATDWPAAKATKTAAPAKTSEIVTTTEDASPVPAPVLFLAGGLLALAAYLRWRQRARS